MTKKNGKKELQNNSFIIKRDKVLVEHLDKLKMNGKERMAKELWPNAPVIEKI